MNKNSSNETNGDYSFDGCGTITFKDMTLKTDGYDYRGFIRIDNTVVENCTLDGKSFYWGYKTAKFTNSTFNAPGTDYAMWGYSSEAMSFDNCTFNISGKGINLYVSDSSGEVRTVAVSDCKVNSKTANKSFLNIKNANQAWNVVFSGTNTVSGLKNNATTGSNLYQVETTDITSGKAVKVQEKAAGDTLKTIFAVSNPAIVNGKEYATLKAAIEAASANDTVTLLANVNEDVTVGSEKSITLDLNGYKLTNKADHTITNNGTLTITDSSADKTGTIDNVTHQKAPVENLQGATCTIEKANITRSLEAGTYSPDNANGNSYYYIENFGTMTIGAEGGNASDVIVSSTGGYSSLVHNGWFSGDKNVSGVDATMTINAGSFAGGKNTIKNDDYGSLTINGGSFKNTNQAAVFNVNKATINGGSFESTAEGVVYTAAYDQKMDWGVTSVYGGEFKSVGTSDFSLCNMGAVPTVTVHGGTFSKDPSAYVVSDYTALKGSDGNYVVADKPATGGTATDGDATGSATTDGNVEVSNNQALANDAVSAAKDVENVTVPETAGDNVTATIGDTTVKVATEQQKKDLADVVDAAKKTAAAVDVKLLVKANTNVEADEKIVESAKASGAEVVPFDLSVDMVTKVTVGDEVKEASVPVAETASKIKVTIPVNADMTNKRATVARNHNGVVDLLSADIDYDNNTITFETDKFSNYATLLTDAVESYKLADYTNTDGTRKSINNSDFTRGADEAFAGWYHDSACTQPWTAKETVDADSTAFPKFVKISSLINFKGGSLRMDQEASEGTSLRFGYETSVPSGAALSKVSWKYNLKGSANTYDVDMTHYLINNDSITANIVLTGAKPAQYSSVICVAETLQYVTADGTSVSVTETAANERSIKGVAEAILDSGYALAADKEYAKAILNAVPSAK